MAQDTRNNDFMGVFDYLLDRYHIVGTPGSGFGPSGEGYFRLTAFNTHENTRRCIERLGATDRK